MDNKPVACTNCFGYGKGPDGKVCNCGLEPYPESWGGNYARFVREEMERQGLKVPQPFAPHCSVMIADESRGYMVPRGWCSKPIAHQHSDGRVYCEEHKNSGQETDLKFAQYQQKLIAKEKFQPLIDEWKIPRMPPLPDGAIHVMDLVRQKCGEQLEKVLTS